MQSRIKWEKWKKWEYGMPYQKVREFFFQLAESGEIVGDLWRELHAVSDVADEADKSRRESRNLFGRWLLSRAHIRILFPEKSLHLFTHSSFLPQIQLFKVWRLGFSSIHTGSVVTFPDYPRVFLIWAYRLSLNIYCWRTCERLILQAFTL